MVDESFYELIGQNQPIKRPELVRRRLQLTERNNKFLDDMEAVGCDANSIVNLALNTFIPKTYNNNFGLEGVQKMCQIK